MKSCAQYIAESKARLGDPRMSDQKLGDHIGYAQQTMAKAKHGDMSDPVAMKLAALLKIDAGEILLVARAEREKDERVKGALLAYAKKVFDSVSLKALSVIGALAVVLSLFQPAPNAQLAYGGEGH